MRDVMMSSGLKMGLNLVKSSVHTCQVRGREGEDLLSPRRPWQASEVSPLLLSPAPPSPEGPPLSCVSPHPPGPPTLPPGCSRGFEPTASHLQTDGHPSWYFPSRGPCHLHISITREGYMEKALTASSEIYLWTSESVFARSSHLYSECKWSYLTRLCLWHWGALVWGKFWVHSALLEDEP